MEDSVERSLQALASRVSLSIPNEAALLRFKHPSSSLIDLRLCDDSYAAVRLLDAFRDSSVFLVDPSDGNWSDCVNSFTLPHYRGHVENASFFTDISDVRDDFTSLLSKVLNSRCQARKYGTVAEKKLLPKPLETEAWARARTRMHLSRKGPSTRDTKITRDSQIKLDLTNTFIRIVLCSLLGNYPHCSTRLQGGARKRLYSILFYSGLTIPTHAFSFFQSLLHVCPVLVKWCLRDYLIAMICDNPGLCSQVETTIRLDDFRRITDQAMASIRTYIQFNLAHEWSSMSQIPETTTFCMCLQPKRIKPKGGCIYASQAWLHDLNSILSPFHEMMLQHKYHKPDTGVIGFFLGKDVRTNHAPLIPLPADEIDEDDDNDDECEKEEELGQRVEDIVMSNLGEHSHHLFREAQRRHQYQKEQEKRDREVTTRFLRYLSPEQFRELSWLVENTQSELHALVEGWFEFFGVDAPTVKTILGLLNAHRDGSVTKNTRLKQTQDLQRSQPHAYNLLQISAELLRMSAQTRPRVIGKLPLGTVMAQIEAASAKFGTEGACETSCLCLFYCGVCGEVYSHIQDETSSVHYKYYRFGLGNVWRDYETGEVYCSRNKVNHRGACDSSPLKRVNLLGIRFSFQKKVYQLCVQCAAIMVPGRSGKDNGKGEMCRACSSVNQDVVTTPLAEFKHTLPPRQCCCCGRECKVDSTTYLLVFGLMVCRHCFRRGVSYHFQRSPPCATLVDAKALAVKWYIERKLREHSRLVRQQKPGMARQKQRDRGRKA